MRNSLFIIFFSLFSASVFAGSDPVFAYHTVQKGETVFRISRMYSMTPDELTALNKIKNNNISVGQKLMVKKTATTEQTDRSAPSKVTPSTEAASIATNVNSNARISSTATNNVTKEWKEESVSELRETTKAKVKIRSEYESLYYQDVYPGLTMRSEKGIATFLDDNSTVNMAYYNNAPVGAIIKLINSDNGKSTYAIVIGKMPKAEENKCLMKLSGKTASCLSARGQSNVQIFCYNDN